MQAILMVTVLLAMFVSSNSLAQGHYEATGEATIKIERSSEYKAKGKEFEKAVPVAMEFNTGACKADLHLKYFQKGTDAHVETTLRNEECGASSGNYTVRVQYRDATGGSKLVEFDETWKRNDASDVTSEKDYFVGDDVDIMRIKSSNLSCRCDGPETIEEQTDSSGPE